MDAFQQMRLHESELTPSERRVFDAVLASPESFLQSSSTIVAKNFGVSQSAVSRFCQKVGFDSFGSFQMSLMLTLSTGDADPHERDRGDGVEYLCDMMRATAQAVRPEVLDALSDRILSSRRVFTTGGGLSAPPALILSMDLLKYNVPCFYMQSGQEMIHMHVAGPDDLVIVFSSKNDTQRMFLNSLDEVPRGRRPHVVMVSHSAAHPLRKLVDELVVLPTWQTERYPVYIEPMTSMVDFCSILMVSVSQKTGKDPKAMPPFVNGARAS